MATLEIYLISQTDVGKWKIMCLYDIDNIYYSSSFTHKYINQFKTPSQIYWNDDEIILWSKNGKNQIKLSKFIEKIKVLINKMMIFDASNEMRIPELSLMIAGMCFELGVM